MHTVQTLFVVAALMTLQSVKTVAQTTSGDTRTNTGSVYSSIGFGMPEDNLSPGSASMGLAGVSTFDPYSANTTNPALWGHNPGTRPFGRGLLRVGYETVDASGSSEVATFSQITVDQFRIVLPILHDQIGFSLGFQPLTRAGYQVMNVGVLEPEPGTNVEPVNYFTEVFGRGGVNRVEAGAGFRLTSNISVGYAGSLLFSSIKRDTQHFFDDSGLGSLAYREEMNGFRMNHRFGANVRHRGILREQDLVSLGATFRLPVRIDMDRSLESVRILQDFPRTIEHISGSAGNGSIHIPAELNLGLTYEPVSTVVLAAEWLGQQWSDAGFSYSPQHESWFTDRNRIAAGGQYHPYRQEGATPGFFNNMKYGVGVSYDTGHLEIDGNRIETLMFHTGFGILSPRSVSSIGLSFQFGIRGIESQNLVRETIWGVKLSLNLTEEMFRRQLFQ